MTDYTRQSIFTSGDVIKAEHGNAEFDQIAAFAAQATGHKHDGTSGEGAYIPVLSDPTNTDKIEIVTGGAKTTGTHQVTGALTADAGVAVTGNITVTGTVDGRDVAADGIVLDAIEPSATADQIAAEVPSTPAGDLVATDVQAALNELDTEKAALAGAAFTGAITTTSTFDGRDVATDGTKLDTIETSAKDDQIASEVVSTPAGTLIATDVQAALNELDTEKAALAGAVFTGNVTAQNIITAGNVDGRDVSVDGTKLDTIETSAKDDQTAAEVVFTPTGLITSTDVQAAVAEVSANIALQVAAKVHHNAVVDVNFAASPLSLLVTNDGNMLQVDTSGGNVVLILPDSTGLSDDMRFSVVKYTADANTVTVNRTGTDTINGATSQVIATQYEHVHFVLDQSDGEWIAAGGVIGAVDAASVTNTPAGNITATDVQAAINELDTLGLPTRNAVMNQQPISQGEATRTGMSSTIYTGNGTAQAVNTGVDMATGDLGGLVWVKDRDSVRSHKLFDTVRGTTKFVESDTTDVEVTNANTVTSFDTTGFSVGSDAAVNESAGLNVAWSFQTNQKTTGTTNRNKAYTAHYNADMGFSIVGYEGDGVDGHEIPHFLGVEPELRLLKNRNEGVSDWLVQGSAVGGRSNFLSLNLTANLQTISDVNIQDTVTFTVGIYADNISTNNIISYNFASVPGVSKVGKYIGTGAAGNYVDCGFKTGFVMVKNLTTAANWILVDQARSAGDAFLIPNASDAETALETVDFVPTGFAINATGVGSNALNDEYLFLAFADSGSGDTTYSYPTTDDVLTVEQNSLFSFANGFNTSGQVDTQETVGASITATLGAGFENKHLWMYKTKAGAYAFSEFRPLEGVTRNDADKWGVVSPVDVSLRTAAKHFDYESATGVALASAETGSNLAWSAFTKQDAVYNGGWSTTSITTSWLQYKQDEKRVLKSWRFQENGDTTQAPKRFTIEGSNDGAAWAAIDSTYTASDYVGNGQDLFGALQDTSANTTSYLYHRINITANNGSAGFTGIAQMEFNTILPSDYYLVEEGKMFDSAGAPIERIYLAEIRTGGTGDVTFLRNLPVAKAKGTDAEYQGDVKVHGEISNRGICTAWVNFDGTQNPPLIRDSFNVADVVDIGDGHWEVIPTFNINAGVVTVSDCDRSLIDISATSHVDGNIIRVKVDNEAGTLVDTSVVSVSVFGGKEIK